MAKISGTDSFNSFLELGLNTTQRKSSSEDGAGLFAAMLQGIPAEGEVAETAQSATTVATVAVSASPQDDTLVSAEVAQTQATTTAAPPVELIDDMMQSVTLPEQILATAAIEQEAEQELATPPGTQEAVQFFEDQMALHNRFATVANTKAASSKTLADNGQTADVVTNTPARSAAPEVRESAPAKGKKTSVSDSDQNAAAPDAEVQSNKPEKTSHIDLLTIADRAPQTDSDSEGNNLPAAPVATAPGTADEFIYDDAPSAADTGFVRPRSRLPAALNFAQGFTTNAVAAGKTLPLSGKALPAGKDDAVKASAGKEQSAMILANFTEVSGLEDAGLSFDDIANNFFGQSDTQGAQAQTPVASTGSFAFDSALQDSRMDSTAPELLPDSATVLEADSTMGSYTWVEDTATQLSWLHEQGVEKAHIKLHPEDLGTLDVSITVNDGQAYVQILTSTPEARELLQNSMPNLREMLQHSGLTLAEGNVAQGDARNGQGFEQNSQQQRFVNIPEAQPQPSSWIRPAVQSRSQIDYYI